MESFKNPREAIKFKQELKALSKNSRREYLNLDNAEKEKLLKPGQRLRERKSKSWSQRKEKLDVLNSAASEIPGISNIQDEPQGEGMAEKSTVHVKNLRFADDLPLPSASGRVDAIDRNQELKVIMKGKSLTKDKELFNDHNKAEMSKV